MGEFIQEPGLVADEEQRLACPRGDWVFECSRVRTGNLKYIPKDRR